MMKVKYKYFILFLIFFIGFIFRAIKFGDIVVGTDVAAFARLGKNFVESGSYTFGENYNMGVFFPPGYPLFIGITDIFANDLFFSARLVSFVSSLLTIAVFYLLGRELYNEEAGIFAAFAYAVYPLSIILGVYGNSDALFFCFFFLAIYVFLLFLKKDRLFYYPLLGIITGIATITRPEGMIMFILPFFHFFGLFGDKPSSTKRHMIGSVIMLFVFIMIISPYIFFVKNYTGKFALSGKNNIAVLLAELSHGKEYHEIVNAPDNLYDKAAFSLTSDKKQLTGWNRNVQRSLLKDYILKDPLKFMRGYIDNMVEQIKTMLKLFLPFIIPLVILIFDRDICKRRTGLIFVLFPIVYFIMYPFFIIIERQTFFIVLFPLLLSSIGFVNSRPAIAYLSGSACVAKSRVIPFLEKNIKCAIIIIFIISNLTYLEFSSFDKIPDPVEHARAGRFIKNTISKEYEKINIMSAKPIVSFYSDAMYTMLPYARGKDVVEFAQLYDVDFIVVDERLLSQWDFYDELMHLEKHSDIVHLAYEDSSGKMIKLFRVKR